MPTESTMANLQLDRAVMKCQIDDLTGHMRKTKIQRQVLEKEHKEAQLHLHATTSQGDAEGTKVATTKLDEIERALIEIQEAVPSMDKKMQALQREHAMKGSEMRRTEVEALNVMSRIRLLQSDLVRMQHKQDANSPLVINALRSIQADLKQSEDKYVALVGEMLPPEAA